MKLVDIARVVRSKNAGPLTLTLDILFDDEPGFELAAQSPSLTAAAIGTLYGREADEITVTRFRPALALKISMPRLIPAGTPGDTDVYGAQQHGPLLEIEL